MTDLTRASNVLERQAREAAVFSSKSGLSRPSNDLGIQAGEPVHLSSMAGLPSA